MKEQSNRKVTSQIKPKPRRHQPGALATARRPATSDQAPGEETVQVNDQYVGGGPAPAHSATEHDQHQTGG
ncbi:MAG TPA: hypothetical protein VLU92_07470 [Candidatus Dormibacteraeota bacterium]|nr:hypothetical protein [Candidatus Dormibacteraeota bacterium]